MFFSSPSGGNANEVLRDAPSFVTDNGKININYLQEFSDYFDGHFGFRDKIISFEHKLVASVFGESEEKKVVLGKDGWLFYEETLADYEGTNLFSPRELYSVAKTLSLMSEYCKDNEMDFVFTIAPNKNSLYPEKMPDRYPRSETASNAQALQDILSGYDVLYVNLFDAFKEVDTPLYRKTDSHWTTEGAGLASDTILTSLGKSFVPCYGDKTKEAPSVGDLYEMLYPSVDDANPDTVYERELSFEYAKPIRSVEDNMIKTVSEGKEGTLFMFRDSFGNTLHPFLASEFEKASFTRQMPYNLTLPKNEKADVLLVEIVERNLNWLISKGAIFPSLRRDINAAVCTDVTDKADYEAKEDENLTGYILIKGNIQKGILKDDDNIYIATKSGVFEAMPCEDDGFCAYISAGDFSGEFDVLIN